MKESSQTKVTNNNWQLKKVTLSLHISSMVRPARLETSLELTPTELLELLPILLIELDCFWDDDVFKGLSFGLFEFVLSVPPTDTYALPLTPEVV